MLCRIKCRYNANSVFPKVSFFVLKINNITVIAAIRSRKGYCLNKLFCAAFGNRIYQRITSAHPIFKSVFFTFLAHFGNSENNTLPVNFVACVCFILIIIKHCICIKCVITVKFDSGKINSSGHICFILKFSRGKLIKLTRKYIVDYGFPDNIGIFIRIKFRRLMNINISPKTHVFKRKSTNFSAYTEIRSNTFTVFIFNIKALNRTHTVNPKIKCTVRFEI